MITKQLTTVAKTVTKPAAIGAGTKLPENMGTSSKNFNLPNNQPNDNDAPDVFADSSENTSSTVKTEQNKEKEAQSSTTSKDNSSKSNDIIDTAKNLTAFASGGTRILVEGVRLENEVKKNEDISQDKKPVEIKEPKSENSVAESSNSSGINAQKTDGDTKESIRQESLPKDDFPIPTPKNTNDNSQEVTNGESEGLVKKAITSFNSIMDKIIGGGDNSNDN